MMNTPDWQYYNIYLHGIIRTAYRTILARHRTFQEIMQALADLEGRSLDQMKPFIIMNVLYLSDEDADFLEESDICNLVI